MSSLHESFYSRRLALELQPYPDGADLHRTLLPRPGGGWALYYHHRGHGLQVCPTCGSVACGQKRCVPEILNDEQVADRMLWSQGRCRTIEAQEVAQHV